MSVAVVSGPMDQHAHGLRPRPTETEHHRAIIQRLDAVERRLRQLERETYLYITLQGWSEREGTAT